MQLMKNREQQIGESTQINKFGESMQITKIGENKSDNWRELEDWR